MFIEFARHCANMFCDAGASASEYKDTYVYLYTTVSIFVHSKIHICIQHSSYLYKAEFIFAYSRGAMDLSISTFQQIVNTCKLCPPKWDLAVFLFSYLWFSLWVCVERGSGWVEKKLKGQVKANMHNLGPLSSSAVRWLTASSLSSSSLPPQSSTSTASACSFS